MDHQFQLRTPRPRNTVRVEPGDGPRLPAWFVALLNVLDALEPDHERSGMPRGYACAGPCRVDADAVAGEFIA